MAPCSDHTTKALRYGTRSQGISQFYPSTAHTSANRMNHTCLCFPSRSWYSFTDPGGWKAELALGGWLVTYRKLNPNTEVYTSAVWRQYTLFTLVVELVNDGRGGSRAGLTIRGPIPTQDGGPSFFLPSPFLPSTSLPFPPLRSRPLKYS